MSDFFRLISFVIGDYAQLFLIKYDDICSKTGVSGVKENWYMVQFSQKKNEERGRKGGRSK